MEGRQQVPPETSVNVYQTTRRHTTEEHYLHVDPELTTSVLLGAAGQSVPELALKQCFVNDAGNTERISEQLLIGNRVKSKNL